MQLRTAAAFFLRIERKKNCLNPLWNQSLKNPFLNSGSLHRWKLGPFQHFISYFILKNQFSTSGLMIMIDWLMIDWSLQDRTSWWDDDHRGHHLALASAFAAESGWSSYPHSSAHTSQKHIYHCHAEHINNKPLLWTSVSVILLQLQQNKEQEYERRKQPFPTFFASPPFFSRVTCIYISEYCLNLMYIFDSIM